MKFLTVMEKNNIQLLSNIIENSGLTSSLIGKLMSEREDVVTKFTYTYDNGLLHNQYYIDLIFLMGDHLYEYPDIIDTLIGIESPKYKTNIAQIKEVIELENSDSVLQNLDNRLENEEITLDEYSKQLDRYFDYKRANREKWSARLGKAMYPEEDTFSTLSFCVLFFYRNDLFVEGLLPINYVIKGFKEHLDGLLVDVEKEEICKKIQPHIDWTDDIYGSIYFQKYKKKCKELLLKKAQDEGIDILAEITKRINDEEWFEKICCSQYVDYPYIKRTIKCNIDIEDVVDKFYEAVFFEKWEKEIDILEEDKAISKLEITKYMTERDYRKDLDVIIEKCIISGIYLYISELINEFKNSYYIRNKDDLSVENKYSKVIEEYAERQRILELKLINQEHKVLSMQKMIMNQKGAELQNELIKELKGENDSLSKEIERLREELRERNELLDLYTCEDQDSFDESSTEISVDELAAKRYMFVCSNNTIEQVLRKQFPNSTFVTTNTQNIDGIKTDGVVYIIKGLKHSMYFKVKGKYGNQKSLLFNSNNLLILYSEMRKVFFEE